VKLRRFLTGAALLGAAFVLVAGVWPLANVRAQAPAAAPQRGALDADTRRRLRETPVVKVFRDASPAVVNIRVRGERVEQSPFFRSPFGGMFPEFGGFNVKREFQSLGTGFVIDDKGHVLTNAHVIEKASEIVVKLVDDRELPAELVGADSDRDLAILKVESNVRLPSVALGSSSDLMIGEQVVAIGNPFGLSHTLSTGVLSAVGRTVQAGEKAFYNFLQTDAPINPGNSGGPLLNILGEVIAVNTAIYSEAQGIGFAIPIDDARRVFDDLITFGQVIEPWIGLQMQELTPDLAEALGYSGRGALIVGVSRSSPAGRAGMKPRDILVSAAGRNVRDLNDYRGIVRSLTVNDTVPFRVMREKSRLTFNLKMTALPLEEVMNIIAERTGLRFGDIPAAMKKRNPGISGVLVESVAQGSVGDQIGFQPGDLVFRVNNRKVEGLKGFQDLVRGSLNRSSLYIHGARGPNRFGVVLPLE